jgi:antitoxin YefM
MQSILFSDVQNDLAEVVEQVCSDGKPVRVTRHDGQSVVMLSWDEYRALEETAYLLGSPRNAARLGEALAESERGCVVARILDED